MTHGYRQAVLIEELIDLVYRLQRRNDELAQSLTAVQTVSTQQVERIRALELELALMKGVAQ